MKLEYSSNNSGGRWWLTDDDWCKLEIAGWEIDWYKDREEDRPNQYPDGRFLDALAGNASKLVASKEDAQRAVEEFEQITGQNVDNEGCNCCGRPHMFTLLDDDDTWVGSFDSEPVKYERKYF